MEEETLDEKAHGVTYIVMHWLGALDETLGDRRDW